MISSQSFPETQFIAVTAYQNEEVSPASATSVSSKCKMLVQVLKTLCSVDRLLL